MNEGIRKNREMRIRMYQTARRDGEILFWMVALNQDLGITYGLGQVDRDSHLGNLVLLFRELWIK